MRNWLEYLPFIIMAELVRSLPRRTALTLGKHLGTLGMWLLPGRRQLSRSNLARAFPEKTATEREAIMREMYAHLGTGFVEMLRLDLLRGAAELKRDFFVEGEEHVRNALAEGRGCILLTGHIGFWEAGNFIFSSLGYPIGVVAKPMRNPLIDNYFLRMREAAGGYIINSRKGARRILKALQQNHLVGVLLDQHAGRHHGVQVPFFGRPAWTTPIIAEIAMKYQVPVVPAFAWWVPGHRYRLEILPGLQLKGELTAERIRDNTALLTRHIEDAVRRDPCQWFWLHRRWRE
jgi:KDO2-lipid IV(A) lauroyltransferase